MQFHVELENTQNQSFLQVFQTVLVALLDSTAPTMIQTQFLNLKFAQQGCIALEVLQVLLELQLVVLAIIVLSGLQQWFLVTQEVIVVPLDFLQLLDFVLPDTIATRDRAYQIQQMEQEEIFVLMGVIVLQDLLHRLLANQDFI